MLSDGMQQKINIIPKGNKNKINLWRLQDE